MTDSESRPAATSAHFVVRAAAEPSVLSRVIELFALRNIVPLSLAVRRDAQPDGGLRIDVEAAGLAAAQVRLIAAKIAQIVSVDGVLADESPMSDQAGLRRSA